MCDVLDRMKLYERARVDARDERACVRLLLSGCDFLNSFKFTLQTSPAQACSRRALTVGRDPGTLSVAQKHERRIGPLELSKLKAMHARRGKSQRLEFHGREINLTRCRLFSIDPIHRHGKKLLLVPTVTNAPTARLARSASSRSKY